ncbi:hypothetical protein [Moorena sp. SIOASIH]|nr:hypothetical protein [Moorena sp. SIOASIH]
MLAVLSGYRGRVSQYPFLQHWHLLPTVAAIAVNASGTWRHPSWLWHPSL